MLTAWAALKCTCCLQGRGEVEALWTFACNLLDRGACPYTEGRVHPTQVSLLSVPFI